MGTAKTCCESCFLEKFDPGMCTDKPVMQQSNRKIMESPKSDESNNAGFVWLELYKNTIQSVL